MKTLISSSIYPSDENVLALLEADGSQYIWGNGTGTIDLTYSFTSAETFNLDDPYWESFYSYTEYIEQGLEEALNQGLLDPYFPAFSEEKSTIRDSLDSWSSVSNINFVEVNENSSNQYGDIRFFQLDFYEMGQFIEDDIWNSAGFAYMPYYDGFDDVLEGDVFLDSYYSPGDGFYEHLVSHEIGHALGLAHPHDGYITTTIENSPLNISESVMSYDEGYFLSATPMSADRDAMEFLYGSSTPNPGDNSYTWTDYELSTYRFSLNDGDGVDTIDLSNWGYWKRYKYGA